MKRKLLVSLQDPSDPPMPDIVLQSMVLWQSLQDALDVQGRLQAKILCSEPPDPTDRN